MEEFPVLNHNTLGYTTINPTIPFPLPAQLNEVYVEEDNESLLPRKLKLFCAWRRFSQVLSSPASIFSLYPSIIDTSSFLQPMLLHLQWTARWKFLPCAGHCWPNQAKKKLRQSRILPLKSSRLLWFIVEAKGYHERSLQQTIRLVPEE